MTKQERGKYELAWANRWLARIASDLDEHKADISSIMPVTEIDRIISAIDKARQIIDTGGTNW